MRNQKVVLDFIRIPVANKVEIARGVIVKIKNNPDFPSPDVSIDDLEAQTNLLETRYIATMDGGKMATALLHQAEEVWDELMRKTAAYVDRIADGDDSVVLSAGFNLIKQRGSTNRSVFEVKHGDKSGTVVLRRYIIQGAHAYIWQYCAGDSPATNDAEWITAQVTTRATAEISGLTTFCTYWFRCAAVTAKGISGYSVSIRLVVI